VLLCCLVAVDAPKLVYWLEVCTKWMCYIVCLF